MLNYRFEFDTTLKPAEVLQRAQAMTREAPPYWEKVKENFGKGKSRPKAFTGTVGEDGFSLRQDINHKNSFLPEIRGSVSPLPTGSHVQVEMQMDPVVMACMGVWLLAIGGATVLLLNPILAAMFCAGLLFAWGAFRLPAGEARRKLERALRGPTA